MLSPIQKARRNRSTSDTAVGVITNPAAIDALRARVETLRPLAQKASAFSSACFDSAFGNTEALIEWEGIVYVADRNDFYEASNDAANLHGLLYRAEQALIAAEVYQRGQTPPPVTLAQIARIKRA
jgi:hypothetical protein